MSTTVGERGDAGRSVASGPVVLETKLARPPVRREHVVRHDLLARVRDARRLTVVTAPPGFGKTTLLAGWAAELEGRLAWLSLDDDDNDPARFLAYVLAALRSVEPRIGTDAFEAQSAGGRPIDVMPLLLNELTAVEEELVLVLDDYHVISNGDVEEMTTYLVEHLPDSLRLVLATREDPPLPLARLRARGHLRELRADELRFDGDETSAFLNDALGLGLTEPDIERLHTRTEGWPAALYLAALSLQGQDDPSSFIEAFAGDDRHVVDYLTEEVLARQPEPLRSFLLRTSILSRLCGSLCDAVTEGEGSTQLLVALERSNLLLIPLDSKREWYRYHHLFAELLRHELNEVEGEALPGLHRRASNWYRERGFVVDAAHHAYAAGDLEAAVDLVGRNSALFLHEGQVATVRGWLDALPQETIAANQPLCLAAAMIASQLGNWEEVERWLERADAAPPALDGLGASTFASLRAWLPMARGDVDAAVAAARLALARPWEPSQAAPPQLVLAAALWWSGQIPEARSAFDAASRSAASAGALALRGLALGGRAAAELDAGEPARAQASAREALALLGRPELRHHPFAGIANIVIGKTLAHDGSLDDAVSHIERGIVQADLNSAWHFKIYGLLALAEIHHGRGEKADARRLLTQAREIVDTLPHPGDPYALARIERTEKMLRLKSPRREEAGEYWELSERELAVLRLLASKLSQREIAAELYVSFNTVKTHMRAIFRKLGVASRTEAVVRARDLGLL